MGAHEVQKVFMNAKALLSVDAAAGLGNETTMIGRGPSNIPSVAIRHLTQSTSEKIPRSVAIIGAGPAGMNTAKVLMKLYPDIKIDIFEKLPVPYGLIRYGIAPDNQAIKNVVNLYNKVLNDKRVKLYANIEIGKHFSYKTLLKNYDATALAIGINKPVVPLGELMKPNNVFIADSIVKWYNGHPEFVNSLKPDFKTVKIIAIMGLGNVALDIIRTILTPMNIKKKYDIPSSVLDQLQSSNVSKIHLIGRKGLEHVKFTAPEVRSIVNLPYMRLCPADNNYISSFTHSNGFSRPSKILLNALVNNLEPPPPKTPVCYFNFYTSIHDVLYDPYSLKLTGINVSIYSPSGAFISSKIIPCEMLIFSYGYSPSTLEDILIGDFPHIISSPNSPNHSSNLPPNLFISSCTTTKSGYNIAMSTHSSMLASHDIIRYINNLDSLSLPPKSGLDFHMFTPFNNYIVDAVGWANIDKFELARGSYLGKCREKVIHPCEMISIAKKITH